MKKPDEIKEALQRHKEADCGHCKYYFCNPCMPELIDDTLAYITELEERIDLMLIQMRGDCGTCAHKLTGAAVCAQCLQGDNRPNWVYEGLPEVNAP